mgnify:CR=1 FL=1
MMQIVSAGNFNSGNYDYDQTGILANVFNTPFCEIIPERETYFNYFLDLDVSDYPVCDNINCDALAVGEIFSGFNSCNKGERVSNVHVEKYTYGVASGSVFLPERPAYPFPFQIKSCYATCDPVVYSGFQYKFKYPEPASYAYFSFECEYPADLDGTIVQPSVTCLIERSTSYLDEEDIARAESNFFDKLPNTFKSTCNLKNECFLTTFLNVLLENVSANVKRGENPNDIYKVNSTNQSMDSNDGQTEEELDERSNIGDNPDDTSIEKIVNAQAAFSNVIKKNNFYMSILWFMEVIISIIIILFYILQIRVIIWIIGNWMPGIFKKIIKMVKDGGKFK